jgi:O-glycosyl hydrolase
MFYQSYAALVLAGVFFLAACAGAQENEPAVRHVTVDSGRTFQTIDGFGLNFAGPYFRDDMKPMFDLLIDDLGITMIRVAPYLVYSDWEVVNDNDNPEILNWEYYNNRYSTPIFEASWKAIRYLNSRGIKPMLAIWGPVPAWMLDDKSTPPAHAVCEPKNPIPPLKPSMYPEFAEQVVSMVMYARSHERLDFEYFSPFNETDCYPNEGPRVDPSEVAGVLSAVARRLKKEGLADIRLAVADQALIENDYITPILKDTELMKQVGAFTFHTYVRRSVSEQVERIKASRYPHVPAWLTEYGELDDQDRSENNEWKKYCLKVGRAGLTALNQGANALFYFNAFDDYEECGRRLCYYGLIHSADQVYYPKKRYYAMKQLYHFVRPGSRRIAAASDGEGLMVSAFQCPGDSLVIVGVKEGGSNRVQIALQDKASVPDRLDLYVTTRTISCQKQGSIPVRDGIAELDLPDEAVFTLVGSTGAVSK